MTQFIPKKGSFCGQQNFPSLVPCIFQVLCPQLDCIQLPTIFLWNIFHKIASLLPPREPGSLSFLSQPWTNTWQALLWTAQSFQLCWAELATVHLVSCFLHSEGTYLSLSSLLRCRLPLLKFSSSWRCLSVIFSKVNREMVGYGTSVLIWDIHLVSGWLKSFSSKQYCFHYCFHGFAHIKIVFRIIHLLFQCC